MKELFAQILQGMNDCNKTDEILQDAAHIADDHLKKAKINHAKLVFSNPLDKSLLEKQIEIDRQRRAFT